MNKYLEIFPPILILNAYHVSSTLFLINSTKIDGLKGRYFYVSDYLHFRLAEKHLLNLDGKNSIGFNVNRYLGFSVSIRNYEFQILSIWDDDSVYYKN